MNRKYRGVALLVPLALLVACGGSGDEEDTVGPVITLLGSHPQDVVVGTTYVDAGATALDNVDGVVSVDTTGAVDISTVGEYELSYSATDSSGNINHGASRTVNVIAADITAPIISLIGSNPANVALGTTYTDAGATASDNIDTSLVPTITTNTVDTSTAGDYEVAYDVSDTAGNAATAVVRAVKVEAITVDTTAYEGTWLGPCVNDSGESHQSKVAVDSGATTATMTIKGYSSTGCSNETITITAPLSVSYPAGYSTTGCVNASKMNTSVVYPVSAMTSQGTISIASEAELNNLGYYQEDYVTAYHLICNKPDGTELYLGDKSTGDGTSEATRPTVLDTTRPLMKQ